MESRIAAALVDSDELRRASFSRLLEAAGIEVAFSAPHGLSAIAALSKTEHSLVFVSFEEPLPRAIQTVEEVARVLPDAIIVAFGDEADTNSYRRALAAGAKYLIDTPVSENETRAIVDAIGPRPVRAAPETGSVVVVAGQKGGIGKTTISVNLASSLANDQRGSVLLMDLDPDFGDAGIMLDLNTNYSTARAARDHAEFEFESFKQSLALHSSGAHLLGAPQNFAERLATRPEDLQQLIAFASKAFDYILIDTPCVLNESVMAALAVADVTLVTTSLEFGSLRNTTLMLSEMAYEGISPQRTVMIANHIDPVSGFSVGDAAEVLEREAIWEIPYDPAMRKSTQLGSPLTLTRPKAAASKSLRALASRLGEDPSRIDRRLAIRGESLAPPEVRARFISTLRRETAPPPVFIFSAGKRATTYHTGDCPSGKRLSAPVAGGWAELPGHLKPCKKCLGEAVAAA
ncbi:MAG: CpaE family protein [Dehalococcoidia bacterium]